MSCDEALLAISAALDGELSPAERVRLSEHLVQCDACRELAEDLRVLTEELEQSDREIPQELAANIRRAVAEEATAAPTPHRRRAPYLRAAAVLALCICLGGVGLFVSGQRTKSDSAGGAFSCNLQTAPKSMEGAANRSIEDNGIDGISDYSTQSDPEAPMEAALVPSPEEAPMPMPSIAPTPAGVTVDGDVNGKRGETAPSSDNVDETAPGSAAPPPDAVITFRRLPEGWEELFPGVASIDAMQAPVGEARVFLQLLEEQGITYEIDLSDAAEASGVSELSDLDENSLCQLLLAESDK